MTTPDGSFVMRLGPAGAGKTTTLRRMAWMEKPDTGDVDLDGRIIRDGTPAARDVAIMFQQYSLYLLLSVQENLAFPLWSPIMRMPLHVIAEKVAEDAAMLRIAHKLDSRVAPLSCGKMRLVAVGRSSVRDPAIYLMNKPLSSLDAEPGAEPRIEVTRCHAELGAPLLSATHDRTEAMTIPSPISALDRGRLAQFGAPRQDHDDLAPKEAAARLGQPRVDSSPAGLLDEPPARAGRTRLPHDHIALGMSQTARFAPFERVDDHMRRHLRPEGDHIIALTDPHTPLIAGETQAVGQREPLCFDAACVRVH